MPPLGRGGGGRGVIVGLWILSSERGPGTDEDLCPWLCGSIIVLGSLKSPMLEPCTSRNHASSQLTRRSVILVLMLVELVSSPVSQCPWGRRNYELFIHSCHAWVLCLCHLMRSSSLSPLPRHKLVSLPVVQVRTGRDREAECG